MLNPAAMAKTELDITKIGVGAAVMGRGGWNTGQGFGSETAVLNPAGLGQLSVFSATSMYTSLLQEFSYVMASAALPFKDLGTLGATYIGSSTDAGTQRDAAQIAYGNLNYSDRVILLSWGGSLPVLGALSNGQNKLYIGSNYKLYEKGFTGLINDSGASASGSELDLGLLYKENDWFQAGLSWSNVLQSKIAWKNGTQTNLPSIIRLGASASLFDRVVLGADFELPAGQSGNTLLHLGGEYRLIDNLVLRAGADQSAHGTSADTNLTLGLGLKYSSLTFDYAFHPYANIAENATHYFSLSYTPEKKVERVVIKPPVEVITLVVSKNIEKVVESAKPIFFLSLSSPNDRFVTLEKEIMVVGKVLEPTVAKVYLNEEQIAYDRDGNFSQPFQLKIGQNVIRIIAIDKEGYILQQIELKQVRLISFLDIDSNYWGASAVQEMATLGVASGFSDGTFRADEPITRLDLAVLLAKAKGVTPTEKQVKMFTDLPVDHWATAHVNASFALGLVGGYQDGSFGIKNKVTRAEGLVMLARFDGLNLSSAIDKDLYTDISAEHWVASAINKAKPLGWLDFISGSEFKEKESLTRAEVLYMLAKTQFGKQQIASLYNWDNIVYKPEGKMTIVNIDGEDQEPRYKFVSNRMAQNIITAKAEQLNNKDSQASSATLVRNVKYTGGTLIADLPEAKESAKEVYSSPSPKLLSKLKGALLGRAVVGSNTNDGPSILSPKASAVEVSNFADKVKISMGPEQVTSKLYLKCAIPADAKVSRVVAVINSTKERIPLYRHDESVWTGSYVVNPNLKPGTNEITFQISAASGLFPDTKTSFFLK